VVNNSGTRERNPNLTIQIVIEEPPESSFRRSAGATIIGAERQLELERDLLPL
jgi:hypothetical protein